MSGTDSTSVQTQGREPVAVVVVRNFLVAVCNDGSVWEYSLVPQWRDWRPSTTAPPIPGTRAALAATDRLHERGAP